MRWRTTAAEETRQMVGGGGATTALTTMTKNNNQQVCDSRGRGQQWLARGRARWCRWRSTVWRTIEAEEMWQTVGGGEATMVLMTTTKKQQSTNERSGEEWGEGGGEMPPVPGGINATLLPLHWQVVLMISVPLPLPQAPQQQQQRPAMPAFLGYGSLMSQAVEAGTITNQ
jgi:hypothetical protein